MIETLMAEYRFTLRQAIWETSLASAFSLFQGRGVRNGAEMAGFTDQAAAKARERAKAYFHENFQVQ